MHYSETYTIRLPAGFGAALDVLAKRRYRKIQDELRQLIAETLETAGIEIDPTAPKPNSKPKERRSTAPAINPEFAQLEAAE
jgi:hypothetical protein